MTQKALYDINCMCIVLKYANTYAQNISNDDFSVLN